MSEEDNTQKLIAAPIPDYNTSIFINAYQNTRENGDMFRLLSIPPTNVSPIASLASTSNVVRTFIIPNEYLIDCRKSYFSIVVDDTKKTTTPGTLSTFSTLFNRSVVTYPGGTSQTSNIGPYGIYIIARTKHQLFNNTLKNAYPTTLSSFCVPLNSINSIFSADYYYSLLLNGVTTITLYMTIPGGTADSLNFNISLVLGCVGNNKMYDYLRANMMMGKKLESKAYGVDCFNGTISSNTILGYYHPSVIAVVIQSPSIDSIVNLTIGSSAKVYYTSGAQSLEEMRYVTMLEMPYLSNFSVIKSTTICFPLYNIDHSDFTGVNCENVTIRLSSSSDITNATVAVIYNTIITYENQKIILSDNVRALL